MGAVTLSAGMPAESARGCPAASLYMDGATSISSVSFDARSWEL